jgi:hypothetical protein
MITKLIHLSTCDEDGEHDAFFDTDGNLIHHIDMSDAQWDDEYMSPLFQKLGIEVERVNTNGENWREEYPDYYWTLNEHCGWGHEKPGYSVTYDLDGNNVECIDFDYVNFRGNSSYRRVQVEGIVFGSNEWHEDRQWLMKGFDLDKRETRYFAMVDMTNVRKYEPEPSMLRSQHS